jgi:lysophospholipase L1-like esterase
VEIRSQESNTVQMTTPPASPKSQPGSTSSTRSLVRAATFRMATVVAALSIFPILELACVIGDWGDVEVHDDPFVGFAAIRPLFELTDDGRRYHISPSRRGFFEEDSFLVNKPQKEFRIFVFGGSTVQGNPFSIETSFTRFLDLALLEADSTRSWKVVNCGGISYASYRIVPLMQECLKYQPDLFIFCEGHNEFLEDVSYTEVRETAPAITRLYATVSRFRSFRLLRSSLLRPFSADARLSSATEAAQRDFKPVLPPEVDALLDHQGGLESYQRDDQHAQQVISHFGTNLVRMICLSRKNNIPLLMIQPPSNLSDCPPFKSQFSDSTTEEQIDQIRTLLERASEVLSTDAEQSAHLLRQAVAVDPRFAWSWYQLGHTLVGLSQFEDARQAFLRARDEDICPLRMTSALEETMQRTVSEFDVDFLNAASLLQQQCPDGIIGNHILADHVHPSFGGHQLIALAIVEWMQTRQFLRPLSADWKNRSNPVFARHLLSLENLYFLKGQRRLKDLQGWAAGRSNGPPLIRKAKP